MYKRSLTLFPLEWQQHRQKERLTPRMMGIGNHIIIIVETTEVKITEIEEITEEVKMAVVEALMEVVGVNRP